ncbi:unnamed protein product [Closterium sp. Naga37s-1]|nr:unnamed protein product [Closterium sp. Naga37s-1]
MPLHAHGVLCMSMGFLMPADVAAVWHRAMVMAVVEKLVRGTDGVGAAGRAAGGHAARHSRGEAQGSPTPTTCANSRFIQPFLPLAPFLFPCPLYSPSRRPLSLPISSACLLPSFLTPPPFCSPSPRPLFFSPPFSFSPPLPPWPLSSPPPRPLLVVAARKAPWWSVALFGAPSDGRTSNDKSWWWRELVMERVRSGAGGDQLPALHLPAVQIHASVAASLAEKKQKRVLFEGLMDRIKHMLPPADMDEVIGATAMVYTHAAVKLSDLSLTFTRQQDMSRSVKLPKEQMTDSSTCYQTAIAFCQMAISIAFPIASFSAGGRIDFSLPPLLPTSSSPLLFKSAPATRWPTPSSRWVCEDACLRTAWYKPVLKRLKTSPPSAVESDGQRTPSLSDVPPLKATL